MNVTSGKEDWKLQAVDGCPAFYTSKPPCWFHRFMQRVFFGFKWTREEITEGGTMKLLESILSNPVAHGLARHALTAAGGALATRGLIATSDVELVVGAAATIGGVLWSAYSKRGKKR